MRIGILTLPLANNNYGGVLQAYALQRYLTSRFDASVEVIDRRYGAQGDLKVRLRKFVSSLLNPGLYQAYKKANSPFDSFKKKYIPLTSPLYSTEAVQKYINKHSFDVLITGSDQVWRVSYAKDLYRDLFLDFKVSGSVKKISYAASFGLDKLDFPDKRDEVAGFLSDFESISVREKHGIQIVKDNFNQPAVCHIDPTLLLNINEYRKLYKHERPIELLNYVLDESEQFQNFIEEVAHRKKLKPFRVGRKVQINKTNYKSLRGHEYNSLEEWLQSFASADFVITDSFHGVVFSILFNKQFIAIGNHSRGLSRFESILSLLGLNERLVTSVEENTFDLLESAIDFTTVNKILDEERTKSFNYFSQLIGRL